MEALCQLHFAEPVRLSAATAGLVWSRIRSDYPKEPEEQGQFEQGVRFDAEQAVAAMQLRQSGSRLVFQNGAEDRLIVLNAMSVSANSLAPYEGWPGLSDRLRDAARTIADEVGVERFSQVTLRYINRIGVPIEGRSEMRIQDYFEVPQRELHGGEVKLASVLQRQEAVINDAFGTEVSFTFANAEIIGSERTDEFPFVLDFEYRRKLANPVSLDEIMVHAADLKNLENSEFESLITDKTRELFQ